MSKPFFQAVSSDLRYDFIGYRRQLMAFSVVLIVASLISLAVRGLNWGIDFAGGTEIQVEFKPSVKQEKLTQKHILEELEKVFPGAEAQKLGADGRNYLFKFNVISSITEAQQKKIENDVRSAFQKDGNPVLLARFRSEGGDKFDFVFTKELSTKAPTTKPSTQPSSETELDKLRKIFTNNGIPQINVGEPSKEPKGTGYVVSFAGLGIKVQEHLAKVYGADSFSILRVESVGPRVGQKLKNDGLLALLLANFFILLYVGIRFDFRYAPGAVLALVHDVTITIGLFSALWIPFDLSIIAALLTIIGYSLNDTIVVFDRIRESWTKSQVDLAAVMNRAINETLSRTLLTSFTTFIAVTPVFFYGGGNIKWFAFAMMFGILIGTYSSIVIASPIVLWIDGYFGQAEVEEEKLAEEKREQRKRRRMGLA